MRDNKLKDKIRKQIEKILENPFIGKSLHFPLGGERTVRIKPFRIIYRVDKNMITFMRLNHRKKAYQ